MSVIRVGVIGCGEVSQIIHLPTLRDLPALFEVTALCDVSPAVLRAVGASWPDAAQFPTHQDLLASGRVDAVLVANPHVAHAETALEAIRAGKHVLLEKPICISLTEADQLQAAEAEHGVVVQVGFMRRYAPAFLEARDRLAGRRADITLMRVHDVIGANRLIIDDTSAVMRGTDLPADARAQAKAAMARATEAAIGVGEGPRAHAYEILLGLGSHDISAMRELVGRPERVLCATQRRGGTVISGVFDFGAFVCHYETAIDSLPHFDAHLEVYTDREVIRVDYDTPYIRHLPARLSVLERHGQAGVAEVRRFGTRQDTFGLEWRAFHDNVTAGRRPKTSLADAREDLELFRDMMAVMD